MSQEVWRANQTCGNNHVKEHLSKCTVDTSYKPEDNKVHRIMRHSFDRLEDMTHHVIPQGRAKFPDGMLLVQSEYGVSTFTCHAKNLYQKY